MMPGISASPSASTVTIDEPRMWPTSTMRPFFTATPPRRGGEPRPSIRITSRITRSNIAAQYTDPMFDLKKKTAVVTGGAKGIGAATAKLFQQAGATVEILDIERGCDVTEEAQVKEAFAR